MTTITDRVKSVTILNDDGRKVVTAFVVDKISTNLSLAQLAQFLAVDVHLSDVNQQWCPVRITRSVHHASPPNGLDA